MFLVSDEENPLSLQNALELTGSWPVCTIHMRAE